MSETIGPNVKKLIIYRISFAAIPKGGGVADGIRFLADNDKIKKAMFESYNWVKSAIQVVRQAAKPNPWIDSTDEEIAEEILRKIEERKL
jgi:hypothetical protein